MDEVYLLRQAVALARHRNFARAAESMNLAQPSLTRGIAALERSLGVPLFDRARSGVVPTAFGRVLLQRGESLLRAHADLRREIQLLAGLETGSLAIGAGPYAAESSVAEAVARVVKAHPRLRVECTIADPDQVVQDVLAGRIDVGVARTGGLDSEARLAVEAFPLVRIYLACRPDHPLTRETRPSLSRALEFPLVTTRLRGNQAAVVFTAGTWTAPDGSTIAEFIPQIMVNSVAVARKIARGSDALFLGTTGHLAEDVAAGRLIQLDLESPALQMHHGVFYLRDRSLAPAAREFIEMLRTVEAELRAQSDLAEATSSTSAKPGAKGRRTARTRR